MKICRNCCERSLSRSKGRSISCRWAGRTRWGRNRPLLGWGLTFAQILSRCPNRLYNEALRGGPTMRSLRAVLASALFFVPLALCQEDHHHALTEEEVGSVHFSTSCRTELAGSFNGAVALLHSFQYEQARQAFAEIASHDPQCALAAGRAALEKAKQVEAGNPKTTDRERAYVEALAEIYREDDKGIAVHAQAFEQKMGALQAGYPED